MTAARIFAATALGCVCLLALGAAGAAVKASVDGLVDRPGEQTLPDKARLSDAALGASVRAQAYVMGASWLRPSRRVAQQRLKAGLLFDLDQVARWGRGADDNGIRQLAVALSQWLGGLPVTGREAAQLDGRALEVLAKENRVLGDGDRLHYPARPDWVRIVGAVVKPCVVPHVPLLDAREYLPMCASTPQADRDIVYIIQPDGRVYERGIALWNRSEPFALAPGATVYVPIRGDVTRAAAPEVNLDIANFLATQPLSGDATGALP